MKIRLLRRLLPMTTVFSSWVGRLRGIRRSVVAREKATVRIRLQHSGAPSPSQDRQRMAVAGVIEARREGTSR
jgi:hypothetical protein